MVPSLIDFFEQGCDWGMPKLPDVDWLYPYILAIACLFLSKTRCVVVCQGHQIQFYKYHMATGVANIRLDPPGLLSFGQPDDWPRWNR